MKCKHCNCDIPKGGKYIGERFTSLAFCSEGCYAAYCKAKDADPMELLKHDIDTLYQGDVNWMLMTKQIQSYQKQYNLSPQDIRLTIRYALKYAEHSFDPDYMLGQFVPKYVEDALTFAKEVQDNKTKAKDWEPEYTIVKVTTKAKRVAVPKANTEWGD